MKKKSKKNLVEFSVIVVVALALYLTGLHTEVIGLVQRGVLATGLMNPKVEQTNTKTVRSTTPGADLNFTLIKEDGTMVHMEQFKGKVIFMNIWATWCPPCIAEMPAIHTLYKEVQDSGIEFVMLSVDEDFQKAIAFRKRKGYDFPIYRIEDGLPPMFQSSSIPTTYVIDAYGTLVMTHKGMANYNSDKFVNYLMNLQK